MRREGERDAEKGQEEKGAARHWAKQVGKCLMFALTGHSEPTQREAKVEQIII